MEAKLKAKELVGMFNFIPLDHENVEPNDIHKQCALIAVDEILKSLVYCVECKIEQTQESNYWQQVKSEITKL